MWKLHFINTLHLLKENLAEKAAISGSQRGAHVKSLKYYQNHYTLSYFRFCEDTYTVGSQKNLPYEEYANSNLKKINKKSIM